MYDNYCIGFFFLQNIKSFYKESAFTKVCQPRMVSIKRSQLYRDTIGFNRGAS